MDGILMRVSNLFPVRLRAAMKTKPDEFHEIDI
jgi:hypothetical protein